MTTLKNLKGTAIQFLDADPVEYVGTWSSGNTIPASGYFWASAGTQTSNIIAGGYGPGGLLNTSFQYNGTDWTAAPNIGTAREQVSGFGASNTAALIAGGATPFKANTEQFDGSSWTEVNDLNTAKCQGAAAGTSYTSGIYFGGRTPPNTALTETESWNGTSWTEVNNLNTAIKSIAGFGITTAAISVGGSLPSPDTQTGTESWNGTSWTEVSGTLNTGRSSMGSSGTQTSGLVFGGTPGPTGKTESWNGTSWTEVGDLAQAAYGRGGSPAGTSQSALASGGEDGSPRNYTEEWSFPPSTSSILQEGLMWFNSSSSALKGYAKSTPSGSWSSGGAMNTARRGQRGSGSKTAGLVFGGGSPPPLVLTESYNGTAFTEVADLNTAKNNGAGFGTQASTIATNEANVELWNGSSWTETTEVNTDREAYAGATGPTSAGIIFGGTAPPYVTNTETWNGSAWTEVNDLNNARAAGGGAGLNSGDAICILGDSNPYSSAYVETWDGTNWTEVTQANTGRYYNGASGASSSSAITYGGYTTAAVANTESWNGTAWTEIADLATARFTGGSGNIGSSSTSAYYAGGGFPDKTNMEEWTVDVTNTTITVS